MGQKPGTLQCSLWALQGPKHKLSTALLQGSTTQKRLPPTHKACFLGPCRALKTGRPRSGLDVGPELACEASAARRPQTQPQVLLKHACVTPSFQCVVKLALPGGGVFGVYLGLVQTYNTAECSLWALQGPKHNLRTALLQGYAAQKRLPPTHKACFLGPCRALKNRNKATPRRGPGEGPKIACEASAPTRPQGQPQVPLCRNCGNDK